jgi:hypothetical protein
MQVLQAAAFALALSTSLAGQGESKASGPDSQPVLPTGEEVLSRYVQATGGRKAYDRIKTLVICSKASRLWSQILIEEYWAPPGRYYGIMRREEEVGPPEQRVHKSTVIFQQGMNGPVVWKVTETMTLMATDKERWRIKWRAALDRDVRWRDFFLTAECKGIKEFEGRSCYAVEMDPTEADLRTDYYDTETHLRVGTEGIIRNYLSDRLPTLHTYGEYHKFGRLLLPTEDTVPIGEMPGVAVTIETVDVNVAIPAERFDPPPNIKALLTEKEISQLHTGPTLAPANGPATRPSKPGSAFVIPPSQRGRLVR